MYHYFSSPWMTNNSNTGIQQNIFRKVSTGVTHVWVAEFKKWHQVCSITSAFWDMGYPNFHHFFDIFLTKSETVLTFWLKKKYVCLKNQLNKDFKCRLDVKDLLKTSLHWKIMSLSKFLSRSLTQIGNNGISSEVWCKLFELTISFKPSSVFLFS